MPSIQRADLDTIERALTLQEDWAAALAIIAKLKDMAASDALIDLARNEHGTDDIEVDDDAGTSPSDTGAWVQAWVYCRYPVCGECDETIACAKCEAAQAAYV